MVMGARLIDARRRRLSVALCGARPRVGRPSANDNGVGQSLEVGIARDQCRPEAPGGGIDERVGHGETVGEDRSAASSASGSSTGTIVARRNADTASIA